MSGPPWMTPTAEGIMWLDAREWKKRALVAESRLHNYRKFVAMFDRMNERKLEGGIQSKEFQDALEDLMIDSGVVYDLDPPFKFYDQVTKGLEQPIKIEQQAGLGSMSVLDVENRKIAINPSMSDAAKALALLFQLVQFADVAAAETGSAEPRVPASWIQDRAPALLLLLVATNVLNPAMGVTTNAILAAAEEHQHKPR